MRVFVDVDDTLVKWASATGSVLINGAEDWEPNCDVINLVRALKAENYKVIVWSAGGENYANMWAQRLMPLITDATYAKFPVIPEAGDVFIDDLYLEGGAYPWQHLSIHPKDLASN